MSLKFFKLSGAGNTFFIFDATESNFASDFKSVFGNKDRATAVLDLCQPPIGLSADGVIFLEKSRTATLKWDFFNSDGSFAEMCGNATRCVARYWFDHKENLSEISIEASHAVVSAKVLQNEIEVRMPVPKAIQKNREVITSNGKISGYYVDTGVPHFVIFDLVKGWNELEIGKEIRSSPDFARGTNVTFVKESNGAYEVKTFERGVEDFTLACGTGALAAGIFLAESGRASFSRPIEMAFPGGILKVLVSSIDEAPLLVGDAKYICKGELSEGAFQ